MFSALSLPLLTTYRSFPGIKTAALRERKRLCCKIWGRPKFENNWSFPQWCCDAWSPLGEKWVDPWWHCGYEDIIIVWYHDERFQIDDQSPCQLLSKAGLQCSIRQLWIFVTSCQFATFSIPPFFPPNLIVSRVYSHNLFPFGWSWRYFWSLSRHALTGNSHPDLHHFHPLELEKANSLPASDGDPAKNHGVWANQAVQWV